MMFDRIFSTLLKPKVEKKIKKEVSKVEDFFTRFKLELVEKVPTKSGRVVGTYRKYGLNQHGEWKFIDVVTQ